MPSVVVCIWNIQNFGAGSAEKFGVASALRNAFIRDVVRTHNIDVLFIQEVSSNGQPSLDNLLQTLNRGLAATDWAFSCCGCGLAADSPDPPTDKRHLIWRTDGRTEGYAVFWRTSQAARFTVLCSTSDIDDETDWILANPRPPPGSVLNMNTQGRPTQREGSYFGPAAGYAVPNTRPFDDTGALTNWAKLSMPSTSVVNPRAIAWGNTRRPIYVVMQLNIAGGTPRQRLVPISVYHAPSDAGKAQWGAFLGGLARELYVSNTALGGQVDPANFAYPDRVIFGGDFNYSVDQADWDSSWYRYFFDPFQDDESGGANCTPAPAPALADSARRTTVQLIEGAAHDVPITGVIDNFLRYKIDLVFSRGNVAGQRLDLPNDLGVAAGPYAATLAAYRVHLLAVVAALAGPNQRMDPGAAGVPGTGPQARDDARSPWHPIIGGSWGGTFLDWNAFMADLNARAFSSARRACEFYHIFISDHLPLIATINF